MAPKVRKLKSNTARRTLQSASSRVQNPTSTQVVIPSKQKKAFLQPYVDRLVQMKINNHQKLPANIYKDTIDTLKEVGINWVTIDSLKSKVKRALKNIPIINNPTEGSVINTTPPPPGVIPLDTSRSIQTIRKKGGRPKGSTNEFKLLVVDCVNV